MNIFKRLSLHFKVAYSYRPYFNNKEKRLDRFEIASNDIDPEIIAIYEQMLLLRPRAYKKEKAKYERYVGAIDEHNKAINDIKELFENWDLNYAINHLGEYTEVRIQRISELLSKYKKLKKAPKEYKEIYDNVSSFCNEYPTILLQYNSLKEYDSIFEIERFPCITMSQKREMLFRATYLLEKFPKGTKLYYSFDKHQNIDNLVCEHNKSYIKSHINLPIFDNVNGFSTDNEQRHAILVDEKSVLVVAGAGSGKTLTICGKVKYLLRQENVKPKDILLLSYSKKSADDLQNKISKIDSGITVGTFHKIGLDVLKEVENKTFAVEDQYKAIIEAYFRDEIKKDTNMLQTVLTYYGLYLFNNRDDKQYENEGEAIEDLKKSDFQTLKDQLIRMSGDAGVKETIKKELVKSYEEMAIANWYFINGIDYIYEAPYEHDVSTFDRRQYLPDFKLKDYPVYHEHYGVDRKNKANQYTKEEAQKYVEGMEWKKQTHRTFNTDCIETYSYEFKEGIIFDKLEKELKSRGVQFKPLSSLEINNALNSVYESRQFKSFINLIRTFLSLYKSTYRDDKGFDSLKESDFKNSYEKHRACIFLDIVKSIYDYYINYLSNENKIDFDDMILQATSELDNTELFKYKYIIIDEFQDISFSRMKFLKRLIKQGESKLFAVGDDWQSIYRFAGCDLSIFLNFSSYFGDTEIVKLTTTYRNSQELQNIAGAFIKTNPEQFDKSISSSKHLEDPIRIMYYTEKKYYAFLDVLREISKLDENANVLILGRNNKDFEDIALDSRVFIDYKNSDETKTIVQCINFPKMKLTYSTVHGAKGLEEDYVVLINADDDRIGFPNKTEDDDLLDLVLADKSKFVYAEERRLWYVALTRTKNVTFIIANASKPSIFVKEIEAHCKMLNEIPIDENKTEISCPRCKSGRLVLRSKTSDNTKFYGCSNYPYCTYTIDNFAAVQKGVRCPSCGDFVIEKYGRYGKYFKCHNTTYCNYSREGDENKKKRLYRKKIKYLI